MGTRQASKFDMLINITSKGGPELQKLGKGAEKAAKVFEAMDAALRKSGATTAQGTAQFKALEGMFKKLITTSQAYQAAREKMAKYKDKPQSAAYQKAAQSMSVAKQRLGEYRKEIDKVFPGLVKLDFRTKSGVKNTKDLSHAMVQAGVAADKYNNTIKKIDNSQEKKINSTKRDTIETKKNTAEVKKNEFAVNQLRQRLDTTGGGTFARLRRTAGALRNQILLLTFATAALRQVFNASFNAANELEASLKGLGAVALNTGASFDGAKQAALDLNKQGLLSIQDAAAGLKNLLSAGFGLPEAIKLMRTLTDAAAFNRQGTLSLGQAVVGATQGIKNQNSIMVDNAGITKNLSIMYKEYAESIGTSAGKLDEAQKRQAIFNGILKEGAVFAGNADAVINTMAGSLTVLGVNSQLAAAEMGKLIQPIASGFIRAFSSSAEATKLYAEELQKSPEEMAKLIQAGYTLEKIFDSLGYIVGQLSKAFTIFASNILTLSVGNYNLLGAFLKITVGMKAYNAVVARSAARTATANKVFEEAGIQLKKNTTLVKFQGKEFSKYNGTLKLVGMTHKVLNDRMSVSISKTRSFKSFMGALRISLKNYSTALQLATGKTSTWGAISVVAINSVKLAWRSFQSTLGPILIGLLVFEGLAQLIGYLTGMGDRLEQATKNAERSDEAFGAFKKQVDALRISMRDSTIVAQKYNDQLLNLSAAEENYKVLKGIQDKITEERIAFTKDLSEKEQAAAQVRIDALQKEYDAQLALVVEYQKKIEATNAKHQTNIANAQLRLVEQEKIINERAGVENYLTALKSYKDILDQQSAFLRTKENAVDKSNEELLRAEKDFNTASLMALEEVEYQKLELIQGSLNQMEAIRVQYAKKQIEADQDEVARVREKFKNLRKEETDRVNDIRINALNAAIASRQAMEKALSDAGSGLGAGAGVTITGLADQGASNNALARAYKFIQADKAYSDQLKDTNLSYVERNKIMGDYLEALTKQKTALTWEYQTGVKMAKEGRVTFSKEDREAYTSMINLIDGQIQRIDNAKNAYKVYRNELDNYDKTVEKINNTAKDTTKTLLDQLNEQEKAEVAAILYREELKELGLTYQKIENDVLLYGNAESNLESALARRTRQLKELAGIQNTFRYSTESLGTTLLNALNPLKLSSQFTREQKQALEEFDLKQTQALNTSSDRVKIAERQSAAEEKLLTDMKNSGFFTEKEILLQKHRIEVAKEKENALNAEHDALEDIQKVEKEMFKDAQAQKRIQQQIDNMKKYAEFFASFVNELNDLESKRLLDNAKYQKTLNKEVFQGTLNQKQANALALENQKLTQAEKTKNEKLYLASLIRDIGRQVMVYAARAAAEKGQIGQALQYLAAGALANVALNRYANQITREAELGYLSAQQRFEAREAEIRGEGTNQPGSANEQRFGGSIKAENLSVEINPTVVIQGEQVFIGQGSVTEFGAELQALLLTSVNDAIENREIDLSNVQG